MKKYKILGFLILGLFIVSGCSSNEKKDNSKAKTEESTNIVESKEEEIETQSISEHFTKDLTDEIWLEIITGKDGLVSTDSFVSSILLTNDTSHDSDLYKGFARYNKDEKGYIVLEMPDPSLSDFKNPENFKFRLIYFYELYVKNKLNQELYHFQIDEKTPFTDIISEGYGAYVSYPHSDKLTFEHLVDIETKEITQKINFEGNDTFLDGSESINRSHDFWASEGEISIELKVEGYPTLYLVGFRDKKENGFFNYFVKFSDRKENYILDALYSNEDIEVVN